MRELQVHVGWMTPVPDETVQHETEKRTANQLRQLRSRLAHQGTDEHPGAGKGGEEPISYAEADSG
jgi:hypothetical protein